MGPTTTYCRALAALLVCLTAMAITGRVEAQPADAGGPVTKAADLARKLEEVQKEAAEFRAEANALRRRLEQELKKSAQAAREVAAQRDTIQLAEAKARQQAADAQAAQGAARQATEQALQEARIAAERATYANQVRAAQEAFARQQEELAGRGPGALDADFERAKAALLRQFNMKREELTAQLRHLDAEQQRMLADLQKSAEVMRERAQHRGQPGGGPSGSSKLDQILERLQGIEMRLNRLERNRPGAPPRQD